MGDGATPRWLAIGGLLGLLVGPSCALIDAIGPGDDDIVDPPTDGGFPVENCRDAVRLGDLTGGAAVGPFDSCTFNFDIDFSNACGTDVDGNLGMLFEFNLAVAQEYVVCVMAPNASTFTVREGFCSEDADGLCSRPDPGLCETLFLNSGETHLYWEPEVDGCSQMSFDINPSMGLPNGPP